METRAVILLLCAVLILPGCGHKGKLKTPEQAAIDQQKKEREAEKRAKREEKNQEKNEPL